MNIFFEILQAYAGKPGADEKTINYLLLSVLTNWVYHSDQPIILIEHRELLGFLSNIMGCYLCNDLEDAQVVEEISKQNEAIMNIIFQIYHNLLAEHVSNEEDVTVYYTVSDVVP